MFVFSQEEFNDEHRQTLMALLNRERCLASKLSKSNEITKANDQSENNGDGGDDAADDAADDLETTTSKPKNCPMEFDGILCWDESPAGQYAFQQCPDWVIGFQNKKEFAKRFCEKNGTWMIKPNSNHSYTDYVPCIENLNAKILAVKHFCLIYFSDKK